MSNKPTSTSSFFVLRKEAIQGNIETLNSLNSGSCMSSNIARAQSSVSRARLGCSRFKCPSGPRFLGAVWSENCETEQADKSLTWLKFNATSQWAVDLELVTVQITPRYRRHSNLDSLASELL